MKPPEDVVISGPEFCATGNGERTRFLGLKIAAWVVPEAEVDGIAAWEVDGPASYFSTDSSAEICIAGLIVDDAAGAQGSLMFNNMYTFSIELSLVSPTCISRMHSVMISSGT